jgi:hypothetical protein
VEQIVDVNGELIAHLHSIHQMPHRWMPVLDLRSWL